MMYAAAMKNTSAQTTAMGRPSFAMSAMASASCFKAGFGAGSYANMWSALVNLLSGDTVLAVSLFVCMISGGILMSSVIVVVMMILVSVIILGVAVAVALPLPDPVNVTSA